MENNLPGHIPPAAPVRKGSANRLKVSYGKWAEELLDSDQKELF